MFIKEETKLTQQQLIDELGIHKNTFKKNKERILDELSEVCEYEIIVENKKIIYYFLTDCDFTYRRKNQAQIQKRDKAFEEAILGTLQVQPLNTAANVNRIISTQWQNIMELGYAHSTSYEYTRMRMRKWFGKDIEPGPCAFEPLKDRGERKGYIKDKVWCMADIANNRYSPMSEEEKKDFSAMVDKYFGEGKEAEKKITSDYDAGTITKKEYRIQLGDLKYSQYCMAKAEFAMKYGYPPMKVPEYSLYPLEVNE